MKEYLEKALHQKVNIIPNSTLFTQLPFIYQSKYDIYNVKINNFEWIAIEPKNEPRLVELRKDIVKLEKITNSHCAFFLKFASFYTKEKLIEEGIPFILKDKQIYLPFLGYLISQNSVRDIKPVNQISFLTQKMLLVAIYEHWENITVTEASKRLNVSKMSITRCFDEVEYLDIRAIFEKGKTRVLSIPKDKYTFFQTILTILRNPIIKKYELEDDIHLPNKAGISALEKLSLISDNNYPTYAITKNELKAIDLKNKKQIRVGQEIGCVVYEVGYFINYLNKNIQDPLSILLTLTKNEKQDERIALSVKAMLEEYVW